MSEAKDILLKVSTLLKITTNLHIPENSSKLLFSVSINFKSNNINNKIWYVGVN